MARVADPVADRWAARPALGAALRLLALLGPVAVGLAVALLLARTVPEPAGGLALAAWWALVLGGSAAAVFGTDRLARRLLPLAILLELSLLFPDRAPSRLRAVRTASVRDLDSRLARLRSHGGSMEPYEAAETVVTLVGILGLHDKRTRGHSERVRAFTDLLTDELDLSEDDRMRLRWAALVHDLGKLTIPTTLLNSKGGLDEEAWELMHRHPDEGVRLLAGLLPWMGEWGDAVAQHHERYDGTGYPRGLAGEEISYGARIVALADSFEVMTSARSYKTSRSAAWARTELTRCAGTQFDPALVRAFLGISIGRLRWVLGPVTWLAELPFVATADRAGQTVKVASVTALAGVLLSVSPLPSGGLPVQLPPGSTAAAAETSSERGTGETAQGSDRVSAPLGVAPAEIELNGDAVDPAAEAPGDAVLSRTGAALTGGSTARAAGPTSDPAVGPTTGGTGGTPSSTTGGTPSGTTGGGATSGGDAGGTPGSGERSAESPPAPAGPALAPVYYLTSRGLQREPASVQEVLDIATGASRAFEARLDRPVVLPAKRELVVHVRFPTRQGNAKMTVALQDCVDGGCTVLSEGLVAQDKATTTTYQRYVVPLVRSGQDEQQVPAGHTLRVVLTFLEPGAKAPGRVAMGGSVTPSRLLLGD